MGHSPVILYAIEKNTGDIYQDLNMRAQIQLEWETMMFTRKTCWTGLARMRQF